MNERRRRMILDWMRKVHQLEYAHRYESLSWLRIERWIGLSAFVLSTIIVFSYRFPHIDIESYSKLFFLFRQEIFVPLASTIVAMLTGIQTFLRPSEKTELHKKTASNYEKLRHKIELILTIRPQGNDLDEQLETIRAEWESLDSINVSQKKFNQGKEKIVSLNKYPKELEFLSAGQGLGVREENQLMRPSPPPS